MADEDLGTGSITIELDEAGVATQVRNVGENLQRILGRASRDAGLRMARNLTSGLVRVEPAISALGRSLIRELTRASRDAGLASTEILRETIEGISPLTVDVDADTSEAQREINALDGQSITVDVDVDDASVRAGLDRNRSALASFGKAVSSVGSAVGTLGKLTGATLGIASLGIAAASATATVSTLVAALAPAAGALAALPAVALGGAAAMGALKLALSGVGDAFKAGLTGDSKEFEKAIKDLAPSAQAAAREVRALKPQFEALKDSVQGAFFDQFKGQITETAKALSGPLKAGLTGISTEFGKATSSVLTFVSSAEGVGRITQVLRGTNDSMKGLDQAAQDVTQGVLAIAGEISETFGAQLGAGIQETAAKLGSFLFEAAEGGKAVDWVGGAIQLFGQLGNIVKNVGGILTNVFQAAGSAGGDILGNFVSLTASVKEFTDSAAGTRLLVDVFTTLNTVSSQFGPILAAIGTALGGILPAIAPLLTAIGPAIVGVINAIGPAIQALIPGVNALVKGLVQGLGDITSSGVLTLLGEGFSKILTAVSPLLPIVGRLVTTLGAALVPVVNALAPVLGAVVGVIGALVTAISPLITVAGQLIAQLGPILTPVLNTLAGIITSLAPLISTLASILGQQLGQQLALLPALMQPFLDSMSILVAKLVPVALQLLAALQPALTSLSQTFSTLAVALIPVLTELTQLTSDILVKLGPLLPPIIAAIGRLAEVFAGQLAATLNNVVLPALRFVAAVMQGDLSGAARALKDTIVGVGKEIVSVFTALPRAIVAATSGFASLLVSAGEDLIRGMIRGISNMASSLVSKAKEVVGSAVSGAKSLLGISSPSKVFKEIGVFTGQGLINGLDASGKGINAAALRMAGAVLDPFAGASPTVNPSVGFAGTTGAGSATFTPASGLPGSTVAGARTIVNNFTINEVGGGDATAQRVINRLVMAGGGL